MRALFSSLLPLLAASLPCQENLVVNSVLGASSGDFCGAGGCTPANVAVPSGYPIQIVTTVGGFQPMFVLVALPPHHCTPLPGFGGALMVPPTGAVFFTNTNWGHFPHAPCAGWMGLTSIALPSLPAGTVLLVQGLVPTPVLQDPWTFTSSVAVTVF